MADTLKTAYTLLNGLITFDAPQEIVPCLRGTPGLGKSDIVRQLAIELATERSTHKPDNCSLCGTMVPKIQDDGTSTLEPIGPHVKLIDVRLANFDPIEVKGLPVVHNATTVWGTPSWFPTHDDEEVILFFDELFNAPPAVQNVSLQVILDRQLHQVRLGEKVRIIAAGNRNDDGTFTSKISTALATRLAIIDIDVDPQEWVDWARGQQLNSEIVAAVEYNPRVLAFNKTSRSTPRTVTKLAKVAARLSATQHRPVHEIVRQFGPAIVGESVAIELAAFIELMETVNTRDIVEKGVIPPKFTDAAKKFATTCAVANYVARIKTLKEKEVDHCLAFCKAIGNEYAIKFLSLCDLAKNRALLTAFLKKEEFRALVQVAAQALGVGGLLRVYDSMGKEPRPRA